MRTEHNLPTFPKKIEWNRLSNESLQALNSPIASLPGTNLYSDILDNAILPDTVNKERKGNHIEQSIK